jgi:hypothetical protein
VEENRREFLKKSALTGAVMWAAPVVTTLPKAAAAGTTPAPCPCANCVAKATALSSLGITLGVASGSDCNCVLDAKIKVDKIAGVSAQVACGKADNATCTASSYVAGIRIRVGDLLNLLGVKIGGIFIEATVLNSCVDCGTGASSIAQLKLVTRDLLGILQLSVDLNVVAGCNTGLNLSGNVGGIVLPHLVALKFNEQFCTNGTLTVRALRVTVLGLDVIAAESKAGAAGCPCTPCGTSRCTPPTSKLC